MVYESYQKTSKERLREKPSKHKELTNFRLSDKQEKEGNVPLEAMQVEGKNGILSVGIRKDGTVTAVFSSDKDGMLREDRKSIQPGHTMRMGGGGRVYTNSHDGEKSALLYEQSIDKPGHFLMTRCRQYLAARENNAVQDSVPFLAAKSAAERARWRQEEAFLYQKLDAGREKLQLLLKKLRSGDKPRVDMTASEFEPEEETAIVSGHEDGKAEVR